MSTSVAPRARTEISTEFDEALGFTIQQYLFSTGMTRVELGTLLRVPGPSISNRLRGKIKWSAADIAICAATFGVTPNDLMPTPDGAGGWVPARFVPGKAKGPVTNDRALAGTPSGTRTLDPQIKSLLL